MLPFFLFDPTELFGFHEKSLLNSSWAALLMEPGRLEEEPDWLPGWLPGRLEEPDWLPGQVEEEPDWLPGRVEEEPDWLPGRVEEPS